jgi:hypothetical protein
MTSMSQNEQSQDDPQPTPENETAAEKGGSRRLQDDPRAQLALAKKNHGANPTAASGAAHKKAAHESSKQGKAEKKVRW